MPFMRRHCRGNPAELLFAVAYLEEEATALCWGLSLQPRYVSFWHIATLSALPHHVGNWGLTGRVPKTCLGQFMTTGRTIPLWDISATGPEPRNYRVL
jgi:hypothetical protein